MMKELGTYVQTVKLISDSLNIEVDEAVECLNILGAVVETICESEDEFDENDIVAAIMKNCSGKRARQVFALLDIDVQMCAEMGKVAIDLKNEIENLDGMVDLVASMIG